MKYIITLIVLKMVQVACPQTQGVHPVMCQTERVDTVTKVFRNRVDAINFYDAVKKKREAGFLGRRGIVQAIKIDSVIQ